MQLIIDIPEEIVKAIQNGEDYRYDIHTAIAQGTPLPKGHGRLIDEKVAYRKFYARCLASIATAVFAETPTIIEADKGDIENG